MSNLLEKASILLTPTAYDDGKILSVKPAPSLGSELITNGDFTNGSTGWALGSGWSIGTGVANASGSVNANISQNSFLTIGSKYEVTYTVLNASTGARVGLAPNGSTVQNIRTENGTYTEIYEAINASFYIRNLWNNGVGLSITNVSVKQVIDGDFDFTRNSSATRVNSQGLIEDMKILSSNLVTNGDFATDSDWGKVNSTISGGTGNLDGTGVTSMLFQDILTNGKTYKVTFTVSDYNSSGNNDIINANGVPLYVLNSNGTFTFTFTHSVSNGTIYWRARNGGVFSIDNISVIEITEDTNLPRIDYSPYSGAGSCGHWLFEPQSTNLITYSETLGNNTTIGGISFTYNNSISPDGTQNAALVSVTSANDRLQPSFAAVNSLVAISIFLKHNGTDFTTQINTFNTGTGTLFGAIANVTASNVTFTSYQGGFDSASFVDYGNGWFRVIVVCQSTTGTTFAQWRPTTVSGTLSYSCFGFQVEQQSYATSYIPTNGSTVTRLQDAAFGAGSSDLINSTEGVLYAEIMPSPLRGSFALSDGNIDNRVSFTYQYGSDIRTNIRIGGTQKNIIGGGNISDSFHKIAVRWDDSTNILSFYKDGGLVNTVSYSGSLGVNTLNNISFTQGDGTSSNFFGKTKCLAVFKEALTDAELTCLTTI